MTHRAILAAAGAAHDQTKIQAAQEKLKAARE